MISWVMASRDDNYNGETIKRLCITISSIINIHNDREIIIIDFCPKWRLLKESLSGFPVKVVTVKRSLFELLKEESKSNMSFYEYLAKDIGSRKAEGEYLVFCNPDNIFPKMNFDEVKNDLNKGLIVRAVRLEIDRKNIELDAPTLINRAEKGDFEAIGRFSTAGGDFTALKKSDYEKIGGYVLAHGSWHLDNEFIDRARIMGFEVSFPYSHYHINHSNSITNSETLKERQEKGFNTDWQNFKPISRKILDRIEEFIE